MRYSITQYIAKGIFRWVDHRFQTEESYWASLSDEEHVEEAHKMEWCADMGMGLFSTKDELLALL